MQIKQWLYRQIFNGQFDLGFGFPHSDTYEVCDQLHMAAQQKERELLQTELAAHQEMAGQGDTNCYVMTKKLQKTK